MRSKLKILLRNPEYNRVNFGEKVKNSIDQQAIAQSLLEETVGLRTLGDVFSVLDSLGVKSWLSWGALLGLTRDNKLLTWDRDIDVAIVGVADMTPINEAMSALGFHLASEATQRGRWVLSKFRRAPYQVDFYAAVPSGDFWHSNYNFGKAVVTIREPMQAVVIREFRGIRLPVPIDQEKHVEAMYGAGWRAPNKHWNMYDNPKMFVQVEATPTNFLRYVMARLRKDGLKRTWNLFRSHE